jgi:hypothetical protein
MDELDEHAGKHCSHLALSDVDYCNYMTKVLLTDDIPLAQEDRFKKYESVKLPVNVYKKLDLRALENAISRRHASFKLK